MQLIGQYDSPFVRRVALALRRYAIAFEHLPLSTFGEGAAFAAHNPLMRVPTLVLDSGEALIDSAAILDHLDEVHGRERAMIAPAGPERRAALRRCAVATGVADKAVSLFYFRRFASAPDPAFAARCAQQIGAGLAELDAAAAARTGEWWFGDVPGHDDVAAACVARFAADAHPALVRLADYPALAGHCARAEARADFRAISQPFAAPA